MAYTSRCTLFIALLIICVKTSYSQQTTHLYISKQTGQYSIYLGSNSKTTDKHESGTVTIKVEGPLQYTVNPNEFSIGPNQTKKWDGAVWGDVSNGPAPGSSVPAKITGDYNVNFSRPAGTGSGGTVTSTYKCAETGSVYDGCSVHGQAGGLHELVNIIGQEIVNFLIYSVNVTTVDSVKVCPGAEKVLNADGFPAGGDYKWEAGGNVEITAGATTANPTIKCKNAGTGTAKVTYTIKGVSYSSTVNINAVEPSITLDKPDTLRVGLNEQFKISPTVTPSGTVQWAVSDGLQLMSGPYNYVAFIKATKGGWQTVTATATVCGKKLAKTIHVYVNPCMLYAPDSIVVLKNVKSTITASTNVTGGNFTWTSGTNIKIVSGGNEASVTIEGTAETKSGWAEVIFKNKDCDVKKRVKVIVIPKPSVRIYASYGNLNSLCKSERRIVNAVGLPAGGSYEWTLSSDALKWYGPTGNNSTVVVEAAKGGACTISCKYTVNGQTATATATVAVREYSKIELTAQPAGKALNQGAKVTYTAKVFDHDGKEVNPPPSLRWKVVYIPVGQENNVGNWYSYELQGNGASQTYTWSFPQGNHPIPQGTAPVMKAWIEAAELCTYHSGSEHVTVTKANK